MRKDYISWDEYFMGIAHLAAERSKDPNTQVGACIVNPEHKIVSVGYNGMPTGVADAEMPWARDGDLLDTKYPYVCHAELNAVLNSVANLKGCTLYVTLFPCNECAKALIQAGIKTVIYADNKYADTDGIKASQLMLKKCGVKFMQYQASGKTIRIQL